MKNVVSFLSMKTALLLVLLLTYSLNGIALDDVIQIKSITAGDSWGDLSPTRLINMDGLNPNPPTDLANTTYQTPGNNVWHTSGNDNSKAWLLIDLGKSLPVSRMYIWNLNQNNNKDRDIKDVLITYSSDSDTGTDGTWQELGNYTIPQSPGNATACKSQISIDFNVPVRFVRIQAKTSYGSNYWGLGKIILLQDHSQGDQLLWALKEQVIIANGFKFYNYTDGTWQQVASALNTAQELIDKESDNTTELTSARQALENALAGLTAKTDLATGSAGTASAFYSSGYEPKNALDNNFNTRWASTSGRSFWYQIDLGSAKTFNQVMIFETPQYSGRIYSVTASVSNDGSTWTAWREKGVGSNRISIAGTPVDARYIQLKFECNSEGMNVDEIKIFNDASAMESIDPTPLRLQDPSWIKQEPATTPNVYQIRKANLKYGMFIHYGMNTFIGEEWTDGSYPESTYNPDLTTLDPESWVKAAYEGGMNFIVLVTKHHEGFALWNTATGTYNINNTGREGDKRDIVKEVADACKKYGIKLGLYYSAWDRNWDRNNTMTSTGLDRVALNQSYNDFALAQVTELMDGRYGEISEFWIDGPWVKNNEDWEFSRLYNAVKTLQPTCQFAVNLTIEGVDPDQMQGGENIYYFPSDFRLADPKFTRPGADADPKIYTHEGKNYYLPFEATICINNSWFWSSKQNASGVISPANIQKAYNHMVDQKNTLVLNLSPNKSGIFNSFDIDGLYAGARTLGIARGGARENIQQGECQVEVRYVTDKGYIAWPTKYIYGKENDDYTALPQDLGPDGYKLISTPANANGKFKKEKIIIEFIYEDTGKSLSSGIRNKTADSYWNAYVAGKEIVLICGEPSDVMIYNTSGITVKKLHLKQKGTEVIDASNFHGFYTVKFTGETGKSHAVKIWV